MAIGAKEVKALRDATGAGMMDCKKALTECQGDFEEAKLWLQKKGIASSQKRAGRSASEGTVLVKVDEAGRKALVFELNCETDFVAKNEEFIAFAEGLAGIAMAEGSRTVDELLEVEREGRPVSQRVMERSGKTGEKVAVGRLAWVEVPEGSPGGIGHYIHDGGKIGVAVAGTTSAEADVDHEAFLQLLKDLAMHIAASDPTVVSADSLDPQEVSRQSEILTAQALESGKPANIVEKMVEGRMNKWKKEVSLLSQPFVKDLDITVEQHIAKVAKESLSGPVRVESFVRYLLGETAEQ